MNQKPKILKCPSCKIGELIEDARGFFWEARTYNCWGCRRKFIKKHGEIVEY